MTSTGSSEPTSSLSSPEFFVDRSLGVTVTKGLGVRGWRVWAIENFFPDKAENTSDEEWIDYGCQRGWALLTKDKAIRRTAGFKIATRPIFALSRGDLPLAVMVDRFDSHRATIWRHSRSPEKEFWIVYENACERNYP
jgi:hypothetical protein